MLNIETNDWYSIPIFQYSLYDSLINIVTDECDLYTIWSIVAKVNTTLVAGCLILEFDEINVVIENY